MEATVSGRAIGLGFAALCVGLVVFILLVSPRLQRQADELLGPDSDVIQLGRIGGSEWTVTASTGDGATCVETAVDGTRASNACLEPEGEPLSALSLATPAGVADRYVVSGIVPADVPQVRVDLSTGEELVPRVYRPGGYPAGFFATTVAPDVRVERMVGLDLQEHELLTRTCDGPLATVQGLGAGCSTQSGGQG